MPRDEARVQPCDCTMQDHEDEACSVKEQMNRTANEIQSLSMSTAQEHRGRAAEAMVYRVHGGSSYPGGFRCANGRSGVSCRCCRSAAIPSGPSAHSLQRRVSAPRTPAPTEAGQVLARTGDRSSVPNALRLGSWERLLMRLSESPSQR